MKPKCRALLSRWHAMLGLTRQETRSWHQDRVKEELMERRAAKTPLQKLSETSDVFFSLLRARYDGFPISGLPTSCISRYSLVLLYMLAKYTLRWSFYRMASLLCQRSPRIGIGQVVNPRKDHNLQQVACRHHINPDLFKQTCHRLLRVFPLLP
jgi:hypothetical protein